MDLNKILEELKQEGSGYSKFGMNDFDNFSRNNNITIKKDKTEVGSSAVYLIPLQLVFPFNPLMPQDKNYNRDRKYIGPYSCSTMLFAIKEAMRKNPVLKEFYCKKAGINPSEYDLNTLTNKKDKVTEQDRLVFGMYREIVHYHALVQKLSYTTLGRWGKKILSNVKLNDAGVVVGKKDLGYKLYEFEQAISSERVNGIFQAYSEGGEKFGQPETDRNKEIKGVWEDNPISQPYKLGSIRVVKIPSDGDYLISDDTKSKIVKEGQKQLGYFERYCSGNKRDMMKYSEYLGKMTDIYFDFLEVGINFPEVTDVDEKSIKLESYTRRDISANPVQRINKQIPRIEEIYRTFRDDTDRFSEDVMLRSVKDYRQMDDDMLLQAVKESMPEKMKYITANTLKNYNTLMSQIDSTLTEGLVESCMSGELEEGAELQNLEGLIAPDEDMKDYSMSPVDDVEEDKLNMDIDDVNLVDVDVAGIE